MSQCLVPNWNLKKQRQQLVEGEEGISTRSSHVHSDWHNHPDPAATHFIPMSNYDEVAELTWENGQLSMHGLGGLLPTSQEKPTWVRAHDTLESIVQQATCQPQESKFTREKHDHAPTSTSSIAASSGEHQMVPMMAKKRSRSNCDQHGRDFSSNTNVFEEYCDLPTPRGCASASDTFCRDKDTTIMTWASLESGRSLRDKILEEDSACHSGSVIRDNHDDRDTRAEIDRSNSTKRNRTAAIHNQSERRRRDRINQKMKALQRLVPHASKSDKASMLEEVINYLKQLQAQIQMMSMTTMPQMMMPLAMQQQLQMSMLARSMGARLGMGVGMGMVNINNMAAPRSFPQLIQPTTIGAPATASIFVAPSSMMPSLIQAPPKQEPAAPSNTNASIPLPAPYCSSTFTQPVNMDLINSMTALYMQQMSQNNQALSSLSQPNREQGN